MTNLTELLTIWIGEEREIVKTTYFKTPQQDKIDEAYNLAKQDLKSKIPDLIKQIENKVAKELIVARFDSEDVVKVIKTLNKQND